MPTPNANESQRDFISRCIPIVIEDGTAQDQTQAVAICNSIWNDKDGDKMDNMIRKTFSGFVTKADEAQGIIEAFFSIFGNVDSGNDIMHNGAFTKTFAERGNKVRVLDNHRTDSIMRAIGKPLQLREAGRDELPQKLLQQHPDATGGAFAKVQLNMKTDEGKGAFFRLQAGDVDEWSFGFDALDTDFETIVRDGKEENIRNIRTVKLFEISPVLFGMNQATTTVSAKEADSNSLDSLCEDCVKEYLNGEAEAYTHAVTRDFKCVFCGQKAIEHYTNRAIIQATEAKAGRVISAATRKRIKTAMDGIRSQINEIDSMLADTDIVIETEQQEISNIAPDEQAALEQAGPQDDEIVEIVNAPTSEEIAKIKRDILIMEALT